MYHLNVKKLGLAFGLTGASFYLGCIIVMASAGQQGTITFFNSLFHGLDTSSIIRMDLPLVEAFWGIVQMFILSWLVGACIAAFYNAQIKKDVD